MIENWDLPGDHHTDSDCPRNGDDPLGTRCVCDDCDHGVSYDAECDLCHEESAEAALAGAVTPHEIGLYFKGKRAAGWTSPVSTTS